MVSSRNVILMKIYISFTNKFKLFIVRSSGVGFAFDGDVLLKVSLIFVILLLLTLGIDPIFQGTLFKSRIS